MGMDIYTENFYGTDEWSVLDKLPPYMKELVQKDEHYNLPEKYKGLELFWSDAGFHGYGVRVRLGRKHDVIKTKVKRVFKELGIDKPKYCSVGMLSV